MNELPTLTHFQPDPRKRFARVSSRLLQCLHCLHFDPFPMRFTCSTIIKSFCSPVKLCFYTVSPAQTLCKIFLPLSNHDFTLFPHVKPWLTYVKPRFYTAITQSNRRCGGGAGKEGRKQPGSSMGGKPDLYPQTAGTGASSFTGLLPQGETPTPAARQTIHAPI